MKDGKKYKKEINNANTINNNNTTNKIYNTSKKKNKIRNKSIKVIIENKKYVRKKNPRNKRHSILAYYLLYILF